jgi:hypothetical protein
MFNPCYPFTTELLESMVQKGVVHYVRSTYKRGLEPNNPSIKGSFLISHYHDPAEAERHYNAIQHDTNRFLYDARIQEHLDKLRIAASQPEGYKVYSRILIPGVEKKITVLFKENTKRYLYKNTNWDLKGRVTIIPFLYFQLGELYTRIRHEGDEIKFKFEDLENI